MFGYIKPKNGELLVKEYEQYRGVYCGLCRSLGTHYGKISRMMLSYDCTFLALFVLGREQTCTGFEKKRCVVNPMKKCTFCMDQNDALHLPAALSVITMYHKLKDDLQDGSFGEKLRTLCLMPFAKRPYKKARREFPELLEILTEMEEAQRFLEKESCGSLDAAAEPTAQMLSKVFALTTTEESEKRICKTIGYFLGKWIYVMDAADDLEDDLKKGSFNPLVTKLYLTEKADDNTIAEAKQYCNGVLNQCVAQVIASVNLLHFPHFAPIIKNILGQGLPEMQRTLLFEKEKHS